MDIDGWQHEEYLDTKVENVPMDPALGADGQHITVRIDTRTGPLRAKVWKMLVGRVSFTYWIATSNPIGRKIES